MASFNDGIAIERLTLSAYRFSPLQRAYLIGFRRARILARRDANAFADRFAVNDEVHVTQHGVRREMARMRAIDHALDAKRSDTLWLNESAQSSRPVAFSTDLKSAALIAPPRVSLISRAIGRLRIWRQRERERGELGRMSQSELHDIGMSSADHWVETHKPFWRN